MLRISLLRKYVAEGYVLLITESETQENLEVSLGCTQRLPTAAIFVSMKPRPMWSDDLP